LSPGDRSRELFEHGIRSLENRFDPALSLVRLEADPARHDLRDSLWYALCLLIGDPPAEQTELAERIIAQVLTAQDRSGGPHHGNFRWFYEDETVEDLNAVEFALERLVHILLRAGDRLSPRTRKAIEHAMRLGFEEIERLDVHWTYTNIYLLEVHNCIFGGELLDEPRLVERGVRRLIDWAERTKADGAPHEFNSPTYSAVQIIALAAVTQWAREGRAARAAREMEEYLWRHVASRWHAPTAQLAGPHSRAYRRDVTGAPGFLKVLLYKLLGGARLLAETPYYSGPGREGDIIVALTDLHCPPDALALFRQAGEREVHDVASGKQGQEIRTYLTPEFALGTMSRPYGAGEPPEPWPQHNPCTVHYLKEAAPGYGLLYCRYVVNDRRPGQSVYPSSGLAADLWDEGLFRSAQNRGNAIVAYGMLPRGYRAVSSLRLDVRLFGPGDGTEILTSDGRWDGSEAVLAPGRPLVIAGGEAYIGLIPLVQDRLDPAAPVTLWRDGTETVISVYNYRGPAKSFWEYRSLSGPFWKGNVRNGFIVSVAPRSQYLSAAAFLDDLRATPLTDETNGTVRRIRFGEGTAAVELEYGLRDLRL
jgi:hypothetical protein